MRLSTFICIPALACCLAVTAAAQVRPELRINTTGNNPGGSAHGIGVANQGNRFVCVWAEKFQVAVVRLYGRVVSGLRHGRVLVSRQWELAEHRKELRHPGASRPSCSN